MPSVTNIAQYSINSANSAFRHRKIKKFFPGDKIIEKLGKSIIYGMDLPNGKSKEIRYIQGHKDYVRLSNGIRSITNYFDNKGNIIRKIKHFFADNKVIQPYKEIAIDKTNNSVAIYMFDFKGVVREATHKTGSRLAYANFDEYQNLLYKDVKGMAENGAIFHDIYDPASNGEELLASKIKYFDGETEDQLYQNDKLTQSVVKHNIDDDVTETEVLKFNEKEQLTQLSRSYSDTVEETNNETIYDYIAGTDDIKKITYIDTSVDEVVKEEIEYEGIFNATGGKIFKNDQLRYLTKYNGEGEITEAKTPEGMKVPLKFVLTYPKNSILNHRYWKEWEYIQPNHSKFIELVEDIELRIN